MLVVPAVIFVLSLVWMQLVKGHGEEEVKKDETERKINFEQAYQVWHIHDPWPCFTMFNLLSGCCYE